MKKWFNKQSRLVQLLLLLIPGVNWVVELCVRWSNFFDKKGLLSLILALLATFTFGVFGWLDFVWVLLFNHLLLAK